MKKNKLSLLALLFVGLVVFTSCKDDDDDPKPNSELIVGTWQVTADVITPAYDFGNGPVSDFYSITDACEKDDLLRINTGGTVVLDEGATKCDPDDAQTTTGTYTFNSSTNQLTYSYGPLSVTGTVSSVNNQNMVLVFTQVEDGVTYTNTTTYVKR